MDYEFSIATGKSFIIRYCIPMTGQGELPKRVNKPLGVSKSVWNNWVLFLNLKFTHLDKNIH